MVWAGKLRGHSKRSRRVYGPDLMLDVCAWSETSGAKHFFYGGADGVAELLAQKLKVKFPKLQVVGTFTPPFRALNETGSDRSANTNPHGASAGHHLGGLEHAEAGEIHGGIFAEVGRDAEVMSGGG